MMNDEYVQLYWDMFYRPSYNTKCYAQEAYERGQRNPWRFLQRPATEAEWLRHLDRTDRFWLGWPCAERANGGSPTQYLVLDVDAKTADLVARAHDAVRKAVELFKDPWFVSTGPSYGFHVYFQLDREMELGALMYGEQSGPVADRLKEVGLGVGKASGLEVYPQRRRCLRGPLGTDQHLVDPNSLKALGYDDLEAAVDYVAGRWQP
jgi:hypothetical protein